MDEYVIMWLFLITWIWLFVQTRKRWSLPLSTGEGVPKVVRVRKKKGDTQNWILATEAPITASVLTLVEGPVVARCPLDALPSYAVLPASNPFEALGLLEEDSVLMMDTAEKGPNLGSVEELTVVNQGWVPIISEVLSTIGRERKEAVPQKKGSTVSKLVLRHSNIYKGTKSLLQSTGVK
ncbi:hypothetical protein Nepgr_005175 [Nepenthes gracilis]|uniref:Uncharacterized protein n=1 Tax=Nepenthes gracilis TaxID=150966 RepID=A0AAD3S359_NEPGR|nr:hypothetical protein Nepgr_005175 [Nepenthes gracilis]